MSSNIITITSAARPIAIRALSALVKDKSAEDLHDSAHDLLRELQSTLLLSDIKLALATVKAEALATALDDLLGTEQLTASDAAVAEKLLDLF